MWLPFACAGLRCGPFQAASSNSASFVPSRAGDLVQSVLFHEAPAEKWFEKQKEKYSWVAWNDSIGLHCTCCYGRNSSNFGRPHLKQLENQFQWDKPFSRERPRSGEPWGCYKGNYNLELGTKPPTFPDALLGIPPRFPSSRSLPQIGLPSSNWFSNCLK